MTHAVHVPAGDGEKVWVVGDTYTLKAPAEMTGGVISLVEASIPAGSGPPPHVHQNEAEAYYVLEGELEVLDGDKTFVARPGSFVFIPKGTLHRFRNIGFGHAHMLVMITPAGFEGFFRAVGQPARSGEQAPPLGPEELTRTVELAPRFGLDLRLPDATPA